LPTILRVNIILFEPEESARWLPRSDPRARHILEVLRRVPGDRFDVGLIDGPRGKATLLSVAQDRLEIEYEWGAPPPPMEPITLLVGLPRPQTARRVLEEATALGVSAMHFVRTERGDAGYAMSKLWSSSEWRRHVMAGAQQAFTTRLPQVTYGESLSEVVSRLPVDGTRVALDNYEAASPLSQAPVRAPVLLALGPERGWSATERGLLGKSGFQLAHLGERVLRLETACGAALAILRSKLGSM
jgi:16S rRNA (uracil1498-N3)-methyltransferase